MADTTASIGDQVIAQLGSYGWTPEQAKGITANLNAESTGLNHKAVGDSGKAYGVAQWHPDRQADFKKFSGKDIKNSTLSDQIDFVNYELQHGKEQAAGRAIAATTNAADAAAVATAQYERPKVNRDGQTMVDNLTDGTSNTTAIAANAAGQKAVAQNDIASQVLSQIAAQQQGVIDSANKVLEGSKDDAALIEQTKGLAIAKAQGQTLNFATMIGANLDASTAVLGKLISQSNDLFAQKQAINERLANASDPTTLFQRPVRWLADYLLQPFTERKLQAVDSQLKATTDQIDWINNATQSYSRVANAMAQTQTQATAEAAANLAKSKIDIEVANQKLEGLRLNSANTIATTNLANNNFSINARINELHNQEVNSDLLRTQRAFAAEQLKIVLADKKTAQEGRQSFIDLHNLGAKANGGMQFKSYQEMENFIKANPQYKDIVATNYSSGFMITHGSQPTLGSTPYNALSYTAKAHPQLDTGRQMLVDKLQNVYSALSSDTNVTKPGEPSNAQLMSKAATATETYNRGVINKAANDAADITVDPKHNLYAPPALESLLADPELAKTYLAQKILTPLATAGAKEIDFSKAIGLLFDAVKSGKISIQQADSELGFLGTKIQMKNNDLYRYKDTAGVPNMSSVNVPVQVRSASPFAGFVPKALVGANIATTLMSDLGGSLGAYTTKAGKLNLIDPVARSQYWNRMMAAEVMKPVAKSKLGDK